MINKSINQDGKWFNKIFCLVPGVAQDVAVLRVDDPAGGNEPAEPLGVGERVPGPYRPPTPSS